MKLTHSMKLTHFACLLLILTIGISTHAYAQSEIEQFEEIGEAFATKLNNLFVVQNPEIVEFLPEVEWDDAFRTSGQCMIDAFRTEGGEDFVSQMLIKGKEFIAKDITSFAEFQKQADFMPEDISQQRQVEISAECGMTALTITRMQESGFEQAVQALPQQ